MRQNRVSAIRRVLAGAAAPMTVYEICDAAGIDRALSRNVRRACELERQAGLMSNGPDRYTDANTREKTWTLTEEDGQRIKIAPAPMADPAIRRAIASQPAVFVAWMLCKSRAASLTE